MTTLADWIETTRYHLDGPKHGALNVLAAPGHTVGGNTLTFQYALKGIAEGAVLSCGTATFYVLATDDAAKTATVVPGFDGSVDTDLAAGALVRVNPRFTDHRIGQALNDTLSAMSSPQAGLFRVKTLDITYVGGVQGYDLADPDLLGVLEVRRQVPGIGLEWPRLRSGEWELLRDAPTSDFASGQGIRLRCGAPGFTVRVTYGARFTPLAATTDDVNTVGGVGRELEDIPPLGAAVALHAGREVARNTLSSQGDTRRAQEVPQQAVLNATAGLASRYRQRVMDESARLRQRHGAML